MKTETLISQILPAQKSDKKLAQEDLRKQNGSNPSASKVAFADLLRPQAAAVTEKKMPRSTPVKRSEPTEAPQSMKAPERNDEASNDPSAKKSSAPQREDRQIDEAARKRFEDRKRLKNSENRTVSETNAQDSQIREAVGSTDQSAQSESSSKSTQGPKKSKLDRETISTIKKVIGDEKQLAESVPAIALLTGHLEHIEPKSIPVVVSSNQFLQDAFSAKEVNSFLMQPGSIGQILSKIGVNDDQINQLAQSGVDVAEFISPADLLGNLGFDVQSLGSEIQILKDNITIKDGLSGYIARAEKLQSKAPRRTLNADASPKIEKEFTEVVPAEDLQQKELLARANQIKNTPVAQTTTSQPVPQQMKRSTEDGTTLMSMVAPAADSAETPDNGAYGKTNDLELAQTPLNENVNDLQTKTTVGFTEDSVQSPMALEHPLSQQTPIKTVEGLTQKAPVREKMSVDELADWMRANVDQQQAPFEVEKTDAPIFGQFAENLDLKKVDLSSIDTQQEQSVIPELNTGSPDDISKLFTNNEFKTTEMLKSNSEQNVALAPEIVVDAKAEELPAAPEYNSDLGQEFQNQKPGNTSENNLAQNLIAANISKNPAVKESIRLNNLERMALAPITSEVAGQSEESTSGQSSQNQDQQQSGSKSNLESITGLGHSKQSGQTTKTDSSFEKMLSLDPPNHVTGKVIDRARMMVKEGGGEVILDLGSDELGKVELAMNVHNNKVELKILAASDQVRELLSNDLATLRESLAIQDLKLSEVEVGVGQRNLSEQNQGFNRNSDSSQFEQRQADNGRNIAQKSGLSRAQGIIRRPLPRTMHHSGRIQVQA